LGEAGEWEKFTNWETGTRVPLMIRAPWVEGSRGVRELDTLAELVDVYPTIAELAGVPLPAGEVFDGQSLVPAMLAASRGLPPPTTLRNFSLSVYPRCPADTQNISSMWRANDCLYVERTAFFSMGVTLRTENYRYTEWALWNGSSLQPRLDEEPIGVELYDHTNDAGTDFDGPYEVVNLANNPSYASVKKQLAAFLRTVYPSSEQDATHTPWWG